MKTQLDNIRMGQFVRLPEGQDAYTAVLKFLKPVNSFAGKKFDARALTYKEVRQCLKLIRTGKTYNELKVLFMLSFKITAKEFDRARVQEFFAAQNYLVGAFFNLQQREVNLLASISADTVLWEMAGGARLNKYGDIMPLIQLGTIYGIYPFDLENKRYSEILTLLTAHKDKAEVQHEFNELKRKQK